MERLRLPHTAFGAFWRPRGHGGRIMQLVLPLRRRSASPLPALPVRSICALCYYGIFTAHLLLRLLPAPALLALAPPVGVGACSGCLACTAALSHLPLSALLQRKGRRFARDERAGALAAYKFSTREVAPGAAGRW